MSLEDKINKSMKTMRIHNIKEDKYDKIKLVPFGDVHYGAKECNIKRAKETIDWVASRPDARIILMGDVINAATRHSIGGGTFEETEVGQHQYDDMIELLEPVKSKIYGGLMGNHEYRVFRETGYDVTKMMAKQLGHKYYGFGIFVKLQVKDQNYIIYATHGSSGATLPYTKIKKVLDMGRFIDADVYCFDDETELLTLEGWKRYPDINMGEALLNFNTHEEKIEIDSVNNIIITEPKELFTLKNSSVDMALTENHRVLFKHSHSKNPNWLFKTPPELKEMQAQIKIPLASKFNDSKINLTNDEIALAGWLISEGHFRKENTAVQICQKGNTKRSLEIKGILDRLGIKYKIYKRKDKQWTFHIPVKEGKKIRENIVNSKQIPEDWFKMNQNQFEVLFDAMMKGDGYWFFPNAGEYYSSDEKLIDRLQMLCSIHGLRTRKNKKKSGFTGKMSNWSLSVCKRDSVDIPLSRINFEKKKYNRKAWCVSTFNGTVIVRRKGRVFISGNCYGHVHSLQVHTQYHKAVNLRNKVVEKQKKYYVLTGHYLNYEDSYAEMKNILPEKQGSPTITFTGGKQGRHIRAIV